MAAARVEAWARPIVLAADVRPAEPAARARGLSGGNQQKIVLARELGRPTLGVLVAAQPTRGVDIGAIEAIHRALVAARDRGAAILVISADLGELEALSDRIVVLLRGRIVAELVGDALTAPGLRERLGEAMTGADARGSREAGWPA
jgi:simple sugar transport system ATP-binding protein